MLALMGALLMLSLPGTARAERWVGRDLTLPSGTFALDLGLGIGHLESGVNDLTGVGLGFAGAFALRSDLELGVTFGARFGTEGPPTRADFYGRPFDTEHFENSPSDVADPQVRLRWAFLRGPIELGLEGQVYVPFNGDFGIAPALPVRLHVGPSVRIDTGLYVPIIFAEPRTVTMISIPLHVWFQATGNLAIGPLTGARHVSPDSDWRIPFGFGIAYALGWKADLKGWMYFPDVSDGNASRRFGFGLGLQIRF